MAQEIVSRHKHNMLSLLYATCLKLLVFLIISRSVRLGMRNVSDKSCRENHNTHFRINSLLFLNRAVYEIM